MYREGASTIRYTSGAFLNPEARQSRDVSVAYLKAHASKDSLVLDATAATGIRGIRYCLEAGTGKVGFLEMNEKAAASMRKNIALNKVKPYVIGKSVQEFANTTNDRFDFIDLDPFGGVTPYIYDLMKISGNGTRLMATATDTAVLCGADQPACIRLYDARPMHNELCHEAGLRILAGYIARTAAQFNFGIEAELSFSYMHYMRVFIRLSHGNGAAMRSVRSMGYAHHCSACLYTGTERSMLPKRTECPECGKGMDVSGRMWLGAINSKDEASKIHDNIGESEERSRSLIESIIGEADAPMYYSIPRITKKLKIGAVSPVSTVASLRSNGFNASLTHMEKNAVKTDATIKDVISAVRKARRP